MAKFRITIVVEAKDREEALELFLDKINEFPNFEIYEVLQPYSKIEKIEGERK